MIDGEAKMREMATAAGLLVDGEPISEELLNYSYLLVHACAQIGDGYWQDDASAGQHIRAVFYP